MLMLEAEDFFFFLETFFPLHLVSLDISVAYSQ